MRALARAQDIDRLCTECASLIDSHEKIAVLSAVHYNLGKTLRDVENIVALPHEAAEAEDMLRDDTQLLQVRGGSPGYLGLRTPSRCWPRLGMPRTCCAIPRSCCKCMWDLVVDRRGRNRERHAHQSGHQLHGVRNAGYADGSHARVLLHAPRLLQRYGLAPHVMAHDMHEPPCMARRRTSACPSWRAPAAWRRPRCSPTPSCAPTTPATSPPTSTRCLLPRMPSPRHVVNLMYQGKECHLCFGRAVYEHACAIPLCIDHVLVT